MLSMQTQTTINSLDSLKSNIRNFYETTIGHAYAGIRGTIQGFGLSFGYLGINLLKNNLYASLGGTGLVFLCGINPVTTQIASLGISVLEFMAYVSVIATLAIFTKDFVQYARAEIANATIDYNNNYKNHVGNFADSHLQHVNVIHKILYSNPAINASTQELEDVFQSFHQFYLQNGFNPNQISDHENFINYLYTHDKIKELDTLVKLGAVEKECVGKAEEFDAQSFTSHGRNSLQWLCAKVINRNSCPQLQQIQHNSQAEAEDAQLVKRAIGELLEVNKKYCL